MAIPFFKEEVFIRPFYGNFKFQHFFYPFEADGKILAGQRNGFTHLSGAGSPAYPVDVVFWILR